MILKNAAVSTIATSLLLVPISFLTAVLLARLMVPTDRGVYAAALSIVTVSSTFAQFGFANSLVYFARVNRIGRPSLRRLTLLLMMAIAISVLTHWKFEGYFSLSLPVYIYLTTAVVTTSVYLSIVSQLDERLVAYNIVRVTQPILFATGVVLIAIAQVKLTPALVVAILCSSSMPSIYIYWRSISRISQYTAEHPVRNIEFAQYAGAIQGTSLIGLAAAHVDKFAVMFLSNLTELGYYAVAFGFSRLVNVVPQSLSTVLFARGVGRSSQKSSQAIGKAFQLTFLPTIGGALLFALIGTLSLTYVFGESYGPAKVPFVFLCAESALSALAWMLQQAFVNNGRPRYLLACHVVGLLCSLAAMLALLSFGQSVLFSISLGMMIFGLVKLSLTIAIIKATELGPNLSYFADLSEYSRMFGKLVTKQPPET